MSDLDFSIRNERESLEPIRSDPIIASYLQPTPKIIVSERSESTAALAKLIAQLAVPASDDPEPPIKPKKIRGFSLILNRKVIKPILLSLIPILFLTGVLYE